MNIIQLLLSGGSTQIVPHVHNSIIKTALDISRCSYQVTVECYDSVWCVCVLGGVAVHSSQRLARPSFSLPSSSHLVLSDSRGSHSARASPRLSWILILFCMSSFTSGRRGTKNVYLIISLHVLTCPNPTMTATFEKVCVCVMSSQVRPGHAKPSQAQPSQVKSDATITSARLLQCPVPVRPCGPCMASATRAKLFALAPI